MGDTAQTDEGKMLAQQNDDILVLKNRVKELEGMVTELELLNSALHKQVSEKNFIIANLERDKE